MRPVMLEDFCDSYEFPGQLDAATIRQALGRSNEFEMEDGYTVRVWGGAIHPEKNWIAWIDYYDRNTPDWLYCNYYLRIRADNKQVFEWNVETYNPAFGAGTIYIKWHGDQLVYIYMEKHYLYGVTATLDRIVTRIELGKIGTQLRVDEDVVSIVPVIGYQDLILRYHLPDWEVLPPLPEADAINQGLVRKP